MQLKPDQIEQFINQEKEGFISRYREIVCSPSVSSQTKHKADIQETAQIAVKFLREIGASADLYETDGNPVVFGRLELDPNAPTVAIYNHLDVQPAESGQDGWEMEPFEFIEKNGRFFARGATDDKGPAMAAWWAASLAKKLELKVNIEFIWELEEEIGSPNFEQFIGKHGHLIKADTILISDTIWVSDKQPAVSMGLRGLCGLTVTLETADKDVHSGLTGGVARNPLTELSNLVAKCVSSKGDILVPGFAETWESATADEIKNFENSGFDLAYFKRAHGLTKLRTEDPVELMKAIWTAPTCEIHGIKGGYQGEGIKTIVPPKAELKMSFRLVPPQEPMQIFNLVKNYILQVLPDAKVAPDSMLTPYKSEPSPELVERVQAAYQFGFDKSPVFVREGGSIGAVVTMADHLKKPIMFMGLSLPEDNYHGPNESFSWQQIEGGTKAFLKYFELSQKT